ncbi:L-arabinose isomerase [candidate division KSB1 bacterium]|nr:L-arabinose isomerase [candidate division KSB1 bacterium]
MIDLKKYEVWFVTGSQHLYGDETLKQVDDHSQEIARALNDAVSIPVSVKFKPVLTTPDAIKNMCIEANTSDKCIGLVTWMHTFSPAKMWINGLKVLSKPFVHLHTQFNRDIPWSAIDMDFMNLNQSAHGGREFGFICSRMGKNRKVVVGHWQNEQVQDKIGVWSRAAAAWHDAQNCKIARLGDNMREVAVTEGNKVSAQIDFGYSVNGYGVGDLVKHVNAATESEVEMLFAEYKNTYDIHPAASIDSIKDAARIELGLRSFLQQGGFKGFTTTFENLHGLKQLPGLSVQRLMAEGYGFGAEGDWKTAALVRAMKVMDSGLAGGTSFMEDYTYHFNPAGEKVLGAHMLEICPSIASGKPSLQVHPLSIGGKEDPARLVFDVDGGDALNVTLVDMGNRFRMIVNEVEAVVPDAPLPKLPVARTLWLPKPNLEIAAGCWILAGGAHHTGFSKSLSTEYFEDFAEMAGIELLVIDARTTVREFKNTIHWNEAYYSK